VEDALREKQKRIEELKKQPEYANTKFVFITPTITSWNLSINNEKNNWDQTKTNIHGFTLRHVCNAIMETCAQYRIPVLGLNLYSGIYYRTEADNNAIGLYKDGIHPNATGHSMIADAISEFLLDNYTLETRVVTDNGHSYLKTPEKQPTCIVDGIGEGKSCITCGEVSIVPHKIPAKGHDEILTPDVKPGVSSPGYVGGTHCIVCGEILTHPETVQPTGIKINATLNQSGVLTISGALSDNPLADGTTFIAIYNSDKRMLDLKNITEFDHSDFSTSIGNMKAACTVKILRWEMINLRPLHDAVEITVEKK
jgi:hypothetical protein